LLGASEGIKKYVTPSGNVIKRFSFIPDGKAQKLGPINGMKGLNEKYHTKLEKTHWLICQEHQ
jgi:hypothetical protein